MAITEDTLVIKNYWYPGRSRHIPLSRIQSVTVREDRLWRWRLVGTGDFRHWLPWDRRRGAKERALVFRLDGHWRPVITPEDPDGALEALRLSAPHF